LLQVLRLANGKSNVRPRGQRARSLDDSTRQSIGRLQGLRAIAAPGNPVPSHMDRVLFPSASIRTAGAGRSSIPRTAVRRGSFSLPTTSSATPPN